MSILIKDIGMPINCQTCFASDDGCRFCKAAKEYIPMLGKPKFCPLIELPDHGDLIDRDAIKVGLWGEDEYKMLCDAKVVIPAERE